MFDAVLTSARRALVISRVTCKRISALFAAVTRAASCTFINTSLCVEIVGILTERLSADRFANTVANDRERLSAFRKDRNEGGPVGTLILKFVQKFDKRKLG